MLIAILQVVLSAPLTWKLWRWSIIWIKIPDTRNHIGSKSYTHGMKFEVKVIFFLVFEHFFMRFYAYWSREIVLSVSLTKKKQLEWIIIATQIPNTHNHISAKSCPLKWNCQVKVIIYNFWALFYVIYGQLEFCKLYCQFHWYENYGNKTLLESKYLIHVYVFL